MFSKHSYRTSNSRVIKTIISMIGLHLVYSVNNPDPSRVCSYFTHVNLHWYNGVFAGGDHDIGFFELVYADGISVTWQHPAVSDPNSGDTRSFDAAVN